MGRPSKYETGIKPYLKEIHDAYVRGVDEKDIAENLGLSMSTFCKYKKEYSELSEVLKRDEKDVKAILETLDNALLRKARGFHYLEEEIAPDGTITQKKKYSPPDTTAIFGAYNRFDKDYIKDKAYYELKVKKLKLEKAVAESKCIDLGFDISDGI